MVVIDDDKYDVKYGWGGACGMAATGRTDVRHRVVVLSRRVLQLIRGWGGWGGGLEGRGRAGGSTVRITLWRTTGTWSSSVSATRRRRPAETRLSAGGAAAAVGRPPAGAAATAC